MVKRLFKENFIYYKLIKNHSSKCKALKQDELTIEKVHIKNYEDFINKCFEHLDKIEIFKKKIKIELLDIYNDKKIILIFL